MSLERVERLLEALGRPQDRLPPVVHVAAPNVTVENRVEPAAVTLEATLPAPAVTVSLPARRTDQDEASAAFLARIVSFQHPDHDTAHGFPSGAP